jgi:hypothetical protein
VSTNIAERGQVMLVRDHIAEHLDEIADLSELWKRRRQSTTESYVRMALVNACGALAMLYEAEERGRQK